MPDTQTPIILEALVEALETMAFVALLPAESPDAPPSDPRLVSIEFTRPSPGRIELVAPVSFGALLAANLQGIAPEDQQAIDGGDDALRELLNVTCGSLLLKRAAACSEPFRVSIPQIRPFDAQQGWAAFIGRDGAHVLNADGDTIAIWLTGLE
jgi:chemotaxis protein CheY-P-specific phosphatase CheC